MRSLFRSHPWHITGKGAQFVARETNGFGEWLAVPAVDPEFSNAPACAALDEQLPVASILVEERENTCVLISLRTQGSTKEIGLIENLIQSKFIGFHSRQYSI